LAVQYNPLVAVVSAVVAAAVAGYPKAPRGRWRTAALIVCAGWLIGDGLRVLGHARDLADGVRGAAYLAPGGPAWLVLGVWALGGLAVGYALPASVGARVGRSVTHGTGWLAAGGVAGGLSVALSAIVGALS
jgi:hypothetical protein